MVSFDDEFNKVKSAYIAARWREQHKIRRALEEAGFTVKSKGIAGQGRSDYTSGGRLTPPFDLSNWMWIDASREGVQVLITLQVLDRDPSSRNIHALFDRIGLRVERLTSTKSEEGATNPMLTAHAAQDNDPLHEGATTGFTLPLSEKNMADMLALIECKIAELP